MGPSSVEGAECAHKRQKPNLELTMSQLEAAGSGRQPRWQGAAVLTPDGLNSPEKHLLRAQSLTHPSYLASPLHADLRSNAEWLLATGRDACRVRLHRVHALRDLAAELEPERSKWNARASTSARALGCRFHLPLQAHVQKAMGVEDMAVPELLNVGLPIVGDALV